ncbi:hypothetical protein [Rhizobium sp. IY2]|uniref:hypothetical protein n=1 Tax=Rhizobium sp. IY2 TaxID=3397853 RepID=UPI0039E068D0
MGQPPTTNAERLSRLRDGWQRSSIPEDFYFAHWDVPKALRRSTKILGALASLTFGKYKGLDGKWVDDDKVVWLEMITSDVPGDGGRLLDALKRACGRCDLLLVGEPVGLKPRDWAADRKWDGRLEVLIHWYISHGFRIVQNGSTTRVVYSRQSSAMNVSLSFT